MPARTTLAANLKALMRASQLYGSTPAIERRTAELGCKVGKSTVDRALREETTLNLDYLEAVAAVFGLDPWQLLVPGLNPDNAPVLRTVGAAEEVLYAKMRALAHQVEALNLPAPTQGAKAA
jgi:hypothetical protein